MGERRNYPGGGRAATCALGDLPALGNLPDAIKQDLAAICCCRSYEAGQTIVDIGPASEFIGIVRAGILRMQKTLPDGRQHIVGLLMEGDMFGRVFSGHLHFSIEAATDTQVYMFRRAPFEAILLQSTELDRMLLQNVLSELDRARDWMIILANTKVRARLAGFLLLLCSRFHTINHLVTVKDGVIRLRIPISRPDLAHLLGTRVESISRAFHALSDDGMIDILQPNLVAIRQIDALASEAGEPDLGDWASMRLPPQATQNRPD